MLLNLLSNALKFTPPDGRVRLTLEKTGEGDGGARYTICVSDNGIGMKQEDVERMFTPFTGERTSTDSGLHGTGLGLSIVRGIVDSMGGTVGVRTVPGQGAAFEVALEFPMTDPPEGARHPACEPPKEISPVRLLLVEDNAINQEIAGMILMQAGYIVETAENGQVAVDMVAASRPGYYALVLMDIQMPVMDGYTATRAIRALDDPALASVPVVAMTANALQKDVRDALDAGMQAHIAKPLDIEKMLATIRDVLGERD